MRSEVTRKAAEAAATKAAMQPPPAETQFDPKEWHTVDGVAELLKVTPSQVRRWVYLGNVGSTILPGGRGRRISGAHLNAALRRGGE
jgi:excisionase family DNA binding protein